MHLGLRRLDSNLDLARANGENKPDSAIPALLVPRHRGKYLLAVQSGAADRQAKTPQDMLNPVGEGQLA